MSNEQKGEEEDQQTKGASVLRWRVMVEERYQKIKENAKTYPYVWASYIVVYGGFGLWFIYRWRKLRKTEDKIRVLQERPFKLIQAKESTNSAVSVQKTLPLADKTP